jgi:1-phosphatidylinositol phosphodiesterase
MKIVTLKTLCLLFLCVNLLNSTHRKKKVKRFFTKTDCWTDTTLKSFSTDTYNSANWMSKIDDNTPIGKLSIPGTHDSGSQGVSDKVSSLLSSVIVTQYSSFEEQLKAGIRYLDIRVSEDGNIYHGDYKTTTTFEGMLNQCKIFLTAYPTETILMRIKYEHGSGESNFVTYFKNLLKTRSSEFNFKSSLPILGEIRGKIWPIINMSGISGYNYGNSFFIKQDNYELQTLKYTIANKITDIKNFIKNSLGKNAVWFKLYINYCSASPVKLILTDIKTVAKQTNCAILDYNEFLGITVFDYPNEYIIKHVIKQNTFKTS